MDWQSLYVRQVGDVPSPYNAEANMILVTGISRAGKTSTISALTALRPEWRHTLASKVLRDLGRPLYDLDEQSAEENQKSLAIELARRGIIADPMAILDGHAVLELRSTFHPISNHAFDALRPAGIAVVYDDVVEIMLRRQSADRKALSLEEIHAFQCSELSHSKYQSTRLGVPCIEVKSGQVERLLDWMRSTQD